LFVGCPGACAVDGAAAGVARLFIRWLAVTRRDCASVRGCQAKTAFLVAP
jgi:hypothetical protein